MATRQGKTITTDVLIAQITDYLCSGGLFNPEMAMHDRVRDLLMDCRDVLQEQKAKL